MELNINNENRNLAVVITIAAMVFLLAIITSLTFEFDIVENLVMSWILTTFYSIFAFLMVRDPIRISEVEKQVIQRVEVPVITEVFRDVPIQIPVENRTVEVIDRPVIQRVEVPVIRTVERKVYIQRKKLNIPKFNFIASSETKTFHKRNCRFSKLIKKKHKLHNNSASWFKKKHFKACKMCIKK